MNEQTLSRRALACAVALCFVGAVQAQNVTLAAYDPQVNDGLAGATIISAGSTVNLSGPQLFAAGTDGSVSTTLASLRDAGRILSGSQWIGAERLSPGPQSFGVTVPDTITGGNRVVSTYSTANLVNIAPVAYTSTVPDVVLVNGGQYINMRVGTITSAGGTMNVGIGTPASGPTAATNGWTINAKQTSMFYADGTAGNASAINWNSVNRITFSGTAATPNDADRLFAVTNVVTYGGTFNVTTVDGMTTSHTVTNAAQLQAYNNFLITQLQAGNLDPANYNTEFSKAVTTATQNIDYGITATGSTDEVFQPIGLRVVVHAVGAQATGTVAAPGQLEVVNSNGGAMRAEQGATITNNGMLSTTHTTGDGTTMLVTSASHAANNGVLNNGLFRNGTAAPTGSSYSGFGVDLSGASDFSNTGVLNLALGTTNGAGAAVGVRVSGGSSAINSGTMNLGVTGSRSNGSLTGVRVDDDTSTFTNQANGLIYLGRAPQFTTGAAAADVALNQQSLSTGITVNANAHVTNAGHIVIGALTQNAAAMNVNGAPTAVVHNDGVIDVNGNATTVPRLNVGMQVTNAGAGSGGDIANGGTINLNGVNGIGIQLTSTGAASSAASSAGTINVAGGADPGSGTRNYGVWAEGQGTGTSTANLAGAVNLLGTGAIGIHARGRATVNVAATSVPTFAGTDEIGFFAYGPNAHINVAPGALLDVTTPRSNLFRLENGATFDGTGLTVRASGANSIAVLGTGASGTAVNTRNATFNVDGAGATGVLVEGGAIGTIDAATTMNLTGTGAVAAIVDGQKHDLFAKGTGTPVASTTLTTLAALNSTAPSLTGYIARNNGKLTNSGNIAFGGAGSTGILVQTGATATNSGNISVTGGGTGIRADATGATAATTANNTGQLTIAAGSIAARTRGAVAQGTRAVVNLNAGSTLQMTGVGAIGAEAAGGTLNVASGVVPTFGNTDQIAFHGSGAGSKINSALSTLNANTARSTIYRLDDGAALTQSSPSTLTASGAGSRALVASGTGTNAILSNTSITVTGNGAAAVESRGGAASTLGAGSSVVLSGPASLGGIVDGQALDLTGAPARAPVATTLTNQSSVTGAGAGTTGFIARNLGSLINSGSIDLTGVGATGVVVQAGGTLANSGLVHVSNGTGVRVEGAGAQNLAPGGRITADTGLAAVRVLGGAELTIGTGDTTITAGGAAHGILVDTGAASLMASGSTITTLGTGNGIENAAEIGGIRLDDVTFNVANGAGLRTATAIDPASTVTFNVTGSGVGYAYRRADGSPGSEDLAFGPGYLAQVTGAGGIGLQALTTGNVTTAATANVTHAAGGAALVAGTAKTTKNTGTLTSLSTVAPVVDLSNGTGTSFTNTGTITARDHTGIAVAGSAGNDSVTLGGGALRGEVATGPGADSFTWTGGSLEGGLTMGAGPGNTALVQGVDLADTYHLLSGSGSGNALTLSNIQSRGGSFASDNLAQGVNFGGGWNTIDFHDGTAFTLTAGLKLAGSDVDIDGSSTLFAGDNVHPVVSSPTPLSANLTNAGTIDLTNGAGSPGNTLTVDGQYISGGGSLLLGSTLNEGGLLGVQETDRMLVNGNATTPGGPTLISVAPASASTGALTDFNHNSAPDATEGISLVQVGGTSTADAFRLKGGYVAAGPWQYVLYAFEPGAADASQRVVRGATAGNRFWDYRLANLYICQDNCTAVTPRNPAATPPPGAPANPVLPEVPIGTTAASPPSVALADGCVSDGIDSCAPGRRAVTPQVPAYISTPTALLEFSYETMDNLHKRLGEIRQAAQGPESTGGEVFARYIGGNYRYNSDRSFQQYGYDFDLDTHAFQVGTNILDLDGDSGTLRGGVAFTHGTTRLDPHALDGDSHGKFTTNSFAMFVTWEHANGFYVDAMASGDRHSGDISTPMRGVDMAHVRANGWNGSVETGYPWHLDSGYVIEPQLQLTRQHLQTDSLVDVDNSTVAWRDIDQVIGRAGVRAYRTWDSGDGRQRTPYVRLNYLQGWGDRAQVTVGAAGTDISQAFDGGRYGRALELGVGGTWSFNRMFSIYGEGDYQKELNDTGLRGWGLNLGVRMEF
ncbi:autotransporter outer membrane beta-barrel domain-containing protein [Pinirhizobacter sp.]|uniref:autotransporter outer membrane beta-barrel domain-containing protein n=1 Tax=Pinirhizobacter sp. TaxID=2950432 RepID=UPI002F401D3D